MKRLLFSQYTSYIWRSLGLAIAIAVPLSLISLSFTEKHSLSIIADQNYSPTSCQTISTPLVNSQCDFWGEKNSDWLAQITKEIAKIEQISQKIASMSSPTPWPTIHPQARLAKVPIIMYHDVLKTKEVFFDLTPEELAADFELIKTKGMNPIDLDTLVEHLRYGKPLPDKPIVLTFDDGYGGHYQYVYPLLKQYGYPAVFSIYTNKMKLKTARSSITWSQLEEMAADPLVTIASHSVSHPADLRQLEDEDLTDEIFTSKQLLESRLGIKIRYFTYPVGKSDPRVQAKVAEAGYQAALSMDDDNEQFAGESPDLLTIGRFGSGSLRRVLPVAWSVPVFSHQSINHTTPVVKQEYVVKEIPLTLIMGGQPRTIHADSRYQVNEIIASTKAIAAVDGAFFSLKYLDSNVIIGPVFSQSPSGFVPGNEEENLLLKGRPLVLIGPDSVRFIPFVPEKHNSLAGLQKEMPELTDAFVAAAWLVKDGQPQNAASFGDLFNFDEPRHRAFWGINLAGQPVIGVSRGRVGSVELGKALAKIGMRDIVMLDSGASTSLAWREESLVNYIPRPVPHVVALFPPSEPSPSLLEEIVELNQLPYIDAISLDMLLD